MGQWLERDVSSVGDSATCLAAEGNYPIVRENWWLRREEEQCRSEIFEHVRGKTEVGVGFR